MILEDYVSFETAKLLKEKGFDGECDYLYVNGNIVRAQGYKYNWNKGETIFTDYKNECSAPTLQMAMKWLRDVHGLFIHIDVIREASCWLADIQDIKGDVSIYPVENEYSNYEEACEAAIRYTLENLI